MIAPVKQIDPLVHIRTTSGSTLLRYVFMLG
jgi:hypothetical protein